MAQSIRYEHPLNERTRNLLRFEFLCLQFAHLASAPSPWEIRAALTALFDILELVGRGDYKSELSKELDRYAATLKRLQKQPGVDAEALATLLHEIDSANTGVRSYANGEAERLRHHEFLANVRQRSSLPGGACQFDVPALHCWLGNDVGACRQQLADWFEPFTVLFTGTALALRLIRDSAEPKQELAKQGFFEKSLDSNTPCQMVQIVLAQAQTAFFPEVSGGKHRFSVRFMEQPDLAQRPKKTDQDVAFELVCCAF